MKFDVQKLREAALELQDVLTRLEKQIERIEAL